MAVAFAAGIAAWFGMTRQSDWMSLIAACLAASVAARLLRADGHHPYIRTAVTWVPLMIALGCLTVWGKSSFVGQEPIARPEFATLTARVLERDERPAEKRTRIVVAARRDAGKPLRLRLNLPEEFDDAAIAPGALVRVQARLMPPAPPMLPGGYDFARIAWFSGLSGTGTVVGSPVVLAPGASGGVFSDLQDRLARHVREQLDGSVGGIAAILAAGDRGGIEETDAQAMRDAGLAHLLSISGLHVSAVIGAAYLLAIRFLALWPWLALRVRLPVLAAATGALAGIGYTLLTGAEVPTVRSCIGAVLVLAALAMGREALSMRILAVAAFLVLLLWPESLVGPS